MEAGLGRHNLPSIPSSFVGRERELQDLRRLLEEHRLVTVIGTGGVGKTRLAIRTATELEPNYRDGSWIVDLAAITDPALVPEAVVAAPTLPQQTGRSTSAA